MHNPLATERTTAQPPLPLVSVGEVLAPAAPADFKATGVAPEILADLALKALYTVPQGTTAWVAQRLHLPQPLVAELLEQLREDRFLEVLGQAGPFGYRYAISQRGRERSQRLLEISGYVGPAPVSLAAYTAMLEWQLAHRPAITPPEVEAGLAELVLTPEAVQLAGLAVSSGRSLFVYGPAGNGKTSLGRQLHNVLKDTLWIPHCIGVDHNVIQLFDPQCHTEAPLPSGEMWAVDQRWVRIQQPLIVIGDEATLDSFDLTHSPALRSYEAPLHLKANGGIFLIDDLGRQRVEPHQLLNRWIIPLENQIDYMTLKTTQKIQVPVRLMLILATNLDPQTIMDPAFLRRLGYRLYLGRPTAERYADIFERYAARRGMNVAPGLIPRLLRRYQAEDRKLRCCEPRDLLERVCDICRYRSVPLEVTEDLLDLAWIGYFGNQLQPANGAETEVP